jgi:hypothetical protein
MPAELTAASRIQTAAKALPKETPERVQEKDQCWCALASPFSIVNKHPRATNNNT